MIFTNLKCKRKYQRGQAITEFNVTAAFLLVPLFIMIPILGKYIDMKHASVQAARYMAWERTVWFEEAPAYTLTGDTKMAHVKSQATLQQETRVRFFSSVNVDELLDPVNDADEEINPLWNDRGTDADERLIINNTDDVLIEYLGSNGNPNNSGSEDVLKKSSSDDVDNPLNDKRSLSYQLIDTSSWFVGKAANFASDLFSFLARTFNSVASAIPGINLQLPASFTTPPNVMDKFQFKGYFRSKVTMDLDDAHFQKVFGLDAPDITSRAAVLTDSWVVEGNDQFMEWTKSFVPFSLLNGPFNAVKPIFNTNIPLIGPAFPELEHLEFGYVNPDPFEPNGSSELSCPDGLCSYE